MVRVFPPGVMVLVTCVNMYRWQKMWHRHGTAESGRLWQMSPANPQISSTSSSATVVTILIMHGMWDQLQICKTGGGTTGPTFYSKKRKKCGFAQHSEEPHPVVQKTTPLPFISVIFLESVKMEARLFEREQWWQSNLQTIFFGLNKRKDIRTITMQKSRFSFK